MTTTTDSDMMSQCCGGEGKFDFDKMKAFMERCGKKAFTTGEIEEMKQICCDHAAFCDKMMQFMKSCGCGCD
jgi:hypothetical protein